MFFASFHWPVSHHASSTHVPIFLNDIVGKRITVFEDMWNKCAKYIQNRPNCFLKSQRAVRRINESQNIIIQGNCQTHNHTDVKTSVGIGSDVSSLSAIMHWIHRRRNHKLSTIVDSFDIPTIPPGTHKQELSDVMKGLEKQGKEMSGPQ